eukprot:2581145-Pleurochrysis_carterae.AAC.1
MLNEIMLGLPATARQTLRQLSSMQQERFLAQREVVSKLRRDYWTVQASLDIRLSNFMPVRAMEEMRLILSKRQRGDGTWYKPVLEPVPEAPRASNRALGIYKPLRVPAPIVRPALLASGLNELLDPYSLHVGGADHNTVSWDV